MIDLRDQNHGRVRTFDTAAKRWAGVGPYYAMFPVAFAESVVERFTEPGDTVLDPFAGRGTAVFAAACQDRCGLGIEINPVGWVYARAKLRPAPEDAVLDRLEELQELAPQYSDEARSLPEFFSACFSPLVRRFLLAARDQLIWKRRAVDWTTMAFLLVYLHGKRDASLSNQLRQTKAMSPDYAVRWWRERGLRPPEVDPVEFLRPRLRWRYAKGVARCTLSNVYLGDSTQLLSRLAVERQPRAKLLFTSPPYIGVTNYHYDQWLRLWLLGGQPNALRIPQGQGGYFRGKFEHRVRYEQFLRSVFEKSKALLRPDAVIYVRSDARAATYEATTSVLRYVFPAHRLRQVDAPIRGQTQTRLFGSEGPKTGEVDLILVPAEAGRIDRIEAVHGERC
jgi:hypothetical protein